MGVKLINFLPEKKLNMVGYNADTIFLRNLVNVASALCVDVKSSRGIKLLTKMSEFNKIMSMCDERKAAG